MHYNCEPDDDQPAGMIESVIVAAAVLALAICLLSQ